MFKRKDEIKGLKDDLDLVWREIVDLRTQVEGGVSSPMRGLPVEPTLNGKVEALATHLGVQFDIQKKVEKVIIKNKKEK